MLQHEGPLRLAAFLTVLAAMALWEVASPCRQRDIPRLIRWSNNLALVVLDTAILRLVFPILAVGMAGLAQSRGWGLFNLWSFPGATSHVAAFLILDLAIYLQHVIFHRVPVLWRLHRMHHADLDFDTTTGLRFHPLEIVISMAIKLAVVLLIGAPPAAVLAFEVILNACALFNHANVQLPARLDGVLRLVLVTPDMHRIHHSLNPRETNSNYGFSLPWWDRMLGTYLAQPAKPQQTMPIGLPQFRTRRDLWLDRMLLQPWRGRAAPPASAPDGQARE